MRKISEISNEDFIEEWQKSKSIKDFCEKLDVDSQSARLKYHYLKKRGVTHLKKMPYPKKDFSFLNELARKSL